MHLKFFLLAAIVCCMAVTAAKAQIGWTPGQIQKKYGKPLRTQPFGHHSVDSTYGANISKVPAFSKLGVSGYFHVTYYNDKAQSLMIVGNNTMYYAKEAGTAFIDEHPDLSAITHYTIGGSNGEPTIEYYYKGYLVHAGIYGLSVYPIPHTKLADLMHLDWEYRRDHLPQDTATQMSREFR